jgi:hypothetical protein
MPTPSGQFQLQDYLAELVARGFDGYSVTDQTTYVNRGYFHVARRSQWYWEQTTDAFTVNPGSYAVDMWPIGTEFPNFRSMDKVVVTTAGFTKKLKLMDEDDFYKWLGFDLTQTQFQGEPYSYFIFNQKLYILSPPNAVRSFLAYYHQRVVPLVQPTDVPITPQHLDEAIMLATLIRCHKRANELTLAMQMEADLEEFFDDMRDDENMITAEEVERTSPDNTWL